MPSIRRASDRMDRVVDNYRRQATEQFAWIFEQFTDTELIELFAPHWENREPETLEEIAAREKYIELCQDLSRNIITVLRTPDEIDRWNTNAANAVSPRLQRRIHTSLM